jgi:2-dehydro-3-deoxygluconokinase
VTIAILGEAMLEVHTSDRGPGGVAFGGDTLNTAVHLARLGHEVAYVTALGQDRLSNTLVSAWRAEGIDTRFVLRHPERQPGIYAVSVDATGERSFLYWREQSAARSLFDLPDITAACDAVAGADLFYFSLVSLAILPNAARQRLLELAGAARARGGKVAYDSNYRPRLWEDRETACSWSQRAMALATIGLPTADDERSMHDADWTDAGIAERWRAAGVAEVAVKAGSAGCVLADGATTPRVVDCTGVALQDSSGAGDAFNAGYLGARLNGDRPERAARAGHRLAAWVIERFGALPQADAGAPYALLRSGPRWAENVPAPAARQGTN